MIVDNFLLPRFLILELLCACHWLEYTKVKDIIPNLFVTFLESFFAKAVTVLTCEANKESQQSHKKGIYELREILDSDNKFSYEFSAVDSKKRGAKGLKEYLEEDGDTSPAREGGGGGGNDCRFSLRKQYWKFPPLLFDKLGNPILPVDDVNNPDMEVVIAHGDPVTVFCPGKKVANSREQVIRRSRDGFS